MQARGHVGVCAGLLGGQREDTWECARAHWAGSTDLMRSFDRSCRGGFKLSAAGVKFPVAVMAVMASSSYWFKRRSVSPFCSRRSLLSAAAVTVGRGVGRGAFAWVCRVIFVGGRVGRAPHGVTT